MKKRKWLKEQMDKGRDSRWSNAVKDRDDRICRFCLKEGTDACHIIGRLDKRLRYVLENGITLCREHHNKFDNNKNFKEFIVNQLLQDVFFLLKEIETNDKSVSECGFTEII